MPRKVKITSFEGIVSAFPKMRAMALRQAEINGLHGPIITGLMKMLEQAQRALEKALSPSTREYDMLEAAVEKFVRDNLEELLARQPGKTIKVDERGVIKVGPKREHIEWDPDLTEAEMVAKLKRMGRGDLLRVEESVNKDAVKLLDRKVAEDLGFSFEFNPEKIEVKPNG